MRIKLYIASTLLITCVCRESSAQMIGIGTMQCADLSRQIAQDAPATTLALTSWVQGFDSSLNVFRVRAGKSPKRLDDKKFSPSAQIAYVMSYCKANPADAVVKGVMKAFHDLPATSDR